MSLCNLRMWREKGVNFANLKKIKPSSITSYQVMESKKYKYN